MEVSHERQRVDIQLEHDQGMCFSCPECATVSPLYDHARERVWRHLDAFEFHTYIHARAPRVQCVEHGIKTCRLPWAEAKSRFTEIFEMRIIETLERVKNLSVACALLKLTWDQVYGVLRRAVARGIGTASTRGVAPHRSG